MQYEVQIVLGRNTFWTFVVTNYDDPLDTVTRDLEEVAHRVGGTLLFVIEKE